MSASMLKTPLHAVLLLMIAMLCVQGSGSLAKILFQSFPVLTVSAMRLFLVRLFWQLSLKFGPSILKWCAGKPFVLMELRSQA